MSLFQAFDENEKEIKNTFSSNLPFGTNIGGQVPLCGGLIAPASGTWVDFMGVFLLILITN